MKILLASGTALVAVTAAFAINLYQDNRAHQAKLDAYENHVQRLMSQVEDIRMNRINFEKEIEQLQSDLALSKSQLTSLSNQLQSALEKVDPDYAQIENDIRDRVAAEFAQPSNYQPQSSVALVRQLSEMDESEFSTLIAMQGRFGPFLSSLNVSDQRLDVIIGALTNLVEQQNQSQQQLMEQSMQLRSDQIAEVQASGGNRREVRERLRSVDFGNLQQQMADIYSPDAQREALAFDLTDSELEALARFQEDQQSDFSTSTSTFIDAGTAGPNSFPIQLNGPLSGQGSSPGRGFRRSRSQ